MRSGQQFPHPPQLAGREGEDHRPHPRVLLHHMPGPQRQFGRKQVGPRLKFGRAQGSQPFDAEQTGGLAAFVPATGVHAVDERMAVARVEEPQRGPGGKRHGAVDRAAAVEMHEVPGPGAGDGALVEESAGYADKFVLRPARHLRQHLGAGHRAAGEGEQPQRRAELQGRAARQAGAGRQIGGDKEIRPRRTRQTAGGERVPDAERIVHPGLGSLAAGRRRDRHLAHDATRARAGEPQPTGPARTGRHPDMAVDRRAQNGATVVVRVVPNELHPPGRAGDHRGRAAMDGRKAIGHRVGRGGN